MWKPQDPRVHFQSSQWQCLGFNKVPAYLERATLILCLCHGVFTDRVIFGLFYWESVLDAIWKNDVRLVVMLTSKLVGEYRQNKSSQKMYVYSQTRPSVATRLSFWHLFDKFLVSLMASGLKRANQIFRTNVTTWWKMLHVCLSNLKVVNGRDFAERS